MKIRHGWKDWIIFSELFAQTKHVLCSQEILIDLTQIQWNLPETATGVIETSFIELLHHYFLVQLNNTATRKNNILDLVITKIPDFVKYAKSGSLKKQKSSLTTTSLTSTPYIIRNTHKKYRELYTNTAAETLVLYVQL